MTDLEQLLQQAENSLSYLMQQGERERQFADESRLRFDKNLSTFEKYYPDIANSIKTFKPRQDFRILVTSSGMGNFVPSHSKVPIYSDNPLEQTQQQLDKNTTKGYYSYTQYNYAVNDNDHRIHSQFMSKLSVVIRKYSNKSLQLLSVLPEHFPSAMIFGIGLGYVVTELLNRHSFDYIFINEPDLEVFYASMFCTDWKDIIESVDNNGGTLFFQVGLSVEDFFSAIYSLAADIGAFSIVRSFCYQHYPSIEVNKQISAFFNRYPELQAGFGFYNDAVTGLAHCLVNYKNKANFFLRKGDKKYIQYPVAVVGNGPSLDSAVEVLRQIQDKIVIFACGTAIGSLAKYGIKADFHVLVERTKTTYDALLDILGPSYYADLNLLSVDVIYPDIIDLYKWVGLGLKGPESATVFTQLMTMRYHRKIMASLPYPGPLVANTGLSFAFMFGFSEVYLFGVDNGYLAGKTHSDNSIYATNEEYKKGVRTDANINLKGNLSQDVKTTSLLFTAQLQMEKLVETDKKISVYNVGEGAFIKGALPLTDEDVFLSNKNTSKYEVVDSLKSSFFFKPNFESVENFLSLNFFDEICCHLNEIASESFSTRKEASDILKRQSRYLYALRKTQYSHLFYMLKGSLLYYHCPMITALYQYEDDTVSLALFDELLCLWRDYVEAMRVDFKESWNKKCDLGMAELIKILNVQS
ncbi:motility associated factor glycosyltransferase family protein [Rheinheimera gaetbuli]